MNFMQPQQYDFSGWGDRLAKIEEGIASLTNQFNSFQPQGEGQNNMVNTPTNTAPEPLGSIGDQMTSIGDQMTSIGDLGFGSKMGRNGPQQSIHTGSKPVSPWSQHLIDGEWRQLTPEEFATKFPNSPFNQNTGYVPEPYNDMQQPLQQGVGIMGLANYQAQQNTGLGI